MMAAQAPRRRDLPAPLRKDTQLIFGAHLSGSNMKGKRKKTKSQKQCDSKENHCVQEARKPEVTSGCSDCRKHRLENEGLKNKIQKLERNLNMGLNIIREVTETKATPGVLDASLAGEFKVLLTRL